MKYMEDELKKLMDEHDYELSECVKHENIAEGHRRRAGLLDKQIKDLKELPIQPN